MEKYTVYLKKFQIAVAILAVALLVFIGVLAKTIPLVGNIVEIQDNYKTQNASLADAERKLQELKDDAAKKEAEDESVLKMFFKPISDGLDTEAAISDEFGEILQVMRDNKIKARSVKYDYDPQDDNFVKNAGAKYHVTAEMIASYGNFAGFLRELYKHEHFLDISSIEILPYQKNKRILLVNLQFKLYAQKDAATAAAEAAAAAEEAKANQQQADSQSTPPSPQPADGGTSPEAE